MVRNWGESTMGEMEASNSSFRSVLALRNIALIGPIRMVVPSEEAVNHEGVELVLHRFECPDLRELPMGQAAAS
jgi:hypothetical protein